MDTNILIANQVHNACKLKNSDRFMRSSQRFCSCKKVMGLLRCPIRQLLHVPKYRVLMLEESIECYNCRVHV